MAATTTADASSVPAGEPAGAVALRVGLELFGWRLALLHLPGVLVTVLTVLAAARALPAHRRD
ncbi:hypothetical protein DLE01_14600, partial [Streptomyces sp. FT05W]